ncbi:MULTISPECIES: very short patch repair endonuclease [unclassified Roseibium]|uniref:very short patch repair endonuclease n=1 Tax=unclassified Roseibium TaxID=2629323 RepID=UPI00273EC5AE|nr:MULTISPECIES: very short patch repair endonuclease [unclassified Roseibium]
MPDIVPADVRSRMMSRIRGKDTKPELMIRKALHAAGFRYRLHDKKLLGKPDLVFTGRKAVIFIHGCFWHGHDCHLFRLPGTRTEFWREKIKRNSERDEIVVKKLTDDGWRIGIVWECALKGKHKKQFNEILDELSGWLCSNQKVIEVRGAR